MAHLAEAYIHFKPYDVPDRRIRSLGKHAEQIAIEVAGEVFGGDVQVHVELEQGSLQTRIAVYGAIALGTYSAVANYKGFKESVVAMCEDAREFAVDVCEPFTHKAGVASNDIVLSTDRDPLTAVELQDLIVSTCEFLNVVSKYLSEQKVFLQRSDR